MGVRLRATTSKDGPAAYVTHTPVLLGCLSTPVAVATATAAAAAVAAHVGAQAQHLVQAGGNLTILCSNQTVGAL